MAQRACPDMSLFTSKISYGLVDGRPVFMDLADDSYFRLEPGEEAEFAVLMNDTGDVHHTIVSSIGAPVASLEHAQCPRPGMTLLDAIRDRRTNLADVARAAMLVGATRRALARRPIAEILSDLGLRMGKGGSDAEQQALAVRFLAARRLVPVTPNCLLDSLALLRWLAASAEGHSLVFGVKLDPFGAHCWIQSETMLINDRPDSVARFAPVRVVECRPPTR